MSDDTEFDPFNQPEGAADASDALPEGDDVLDGIDLDTDLDDLFAGADLELSEDETDEQIKVYEAGDTYVNPLDVGLKDKMWVPIRIQTAEFKEKHKPRLSSKVCVAVKVGEDGKKRVYVPFDQVEAALQVGATEVVTEMELPYFICEANHVAPAFGQRRYPYEIESPALTIKTAFFKEQRSGRKGYKNEDGASLRKAAEATEPGERINIQTMPAIAKRLEEKIVMAQITLSTKTKKRPRLDGSNQPISVLVDADTGAPIKVRALERQEGDTQTTYMVDDNSGSIWEGNEKLLIGLGDGTYAIADKGETSAPLMDDYVQTTDYLKTKFLPVPERKVEVEMRSGETISGEITWDTVGAIALNRAPGTSVDVLLRNGSTVTAVWLGTQWTELAKEGDKSQGDGLDEFSGASNL
jgi:hypothetical protein